MELTNKSTKVAAVQNLEWQSFNGDMAQAEAAVAEMKENGINAFVEGPRGQSTEIGIQIDIGYNRDPGSPQAMKAMQIMQKHEGGSPPGSDPFGG